MLSFLKSHNTKFLLLFSVFSCGLLVIRFFFGIKGANFSFLTFNLFLAWIPYLVSQLFRLKNISLGLLLPSILVWLLFFPNALYVITDLFQLWPRPKGSFWFDLIMISSFAFTSFFLGFASLKNLEGYFSRKIKNEIKLQAIIFSFIYLGSLGVYLGRFRRWNSWDVLYKWAYLKREGIYFFENPLEDADFYATTFVFAVFCYIMYYGIFHFGKNHE